MLKLTTLFLAILIIQKAAGEDESTTSPTDDSTTSPTDESTTKPVENENLTTVENEKLVTGDTETTTDDGAEYVDGSPGVRRTYLKISDMNLKPPPNVITDRGGKPVTETHIFNVTLRHGNNLEVVSEKYKTFYTHPHTQPGCQCLTRAPISHFKKIGNLHFPKIKGKTTGFVTKPTQGTTERECPPCVCPLPPPPPPCTTDNT